MTLDELIAQMTDPLEFTRLCNAIFADIYAHDFQVIDGTRGDNGNDGYVASERRMLAMHCPVKPEQRKDADYLDKIKADFAKAVKLRDDGTYRIDAWTFITPRKLSDDLIGKMRALGQQLGIDASHQEATFLANELHRRDHLLKGFPTLVQLRLDAKLDEVLAILRQRSASTSTADPAKPDQIGHPKVRDEAGDARLHELAEQVPTNEAKAKLRALAYEATDPILEINAILLLFRWFAPADDSTSELSAFADRGIVRAKQVHMTGAEALFHAQKAAMHAWEFNQSVVESHYSDLADMLVPFALTPQEQRRRRAARARGLEESLNKEASIAIDLIKGSRDSEEVSSVLLVLGTAIGQIAHMQRFIGASANADRQLAQCKSLLLASKDAAASGGDELGATTVVFNLANQIRFHGDNGEALQLVKSTIPIAEKYGDLLLLQKAKWLLEALETGETPDYAAGERREWTVTLRPKGTGS